MKKTARAAVLVAPGKFEMREFPIPSIGDDEMLVILIEGENLKKCEVDF